jgi:hypothetical protein
LKATNVELAVSNLTVKAGEFVKVINVEDAALNPTVRALDHVKAVDVQNLLTENYNPK